MTQVPSPAERLRAVRDALGCTWTALAEAFGICTRSLEHYRRGDRAMPRRVGHCVARLEIRLGLPCSDPPLVLFAEFAPAVRELEAAVTARLEPLLSEMEARRKAREEALDRLVARSEGRRKARAKAEATRRVMREARRIARAEAEEARLARREAMEEGRAEARAARASAAAVAPRSVAALEAFKWELRNRGGSFTQWCGRVGVSPQTAERALTRPLWPGERAARIRAAAAATLRDMGGGL